MQHAAPHELRSRIDRAFYPGVQIDEYDAVKAQSQDEARAAILAYARVAVNPHSFLLGIAADLGGDADETDMLMNLTQALLHSIDGQHEDAANCAENMVDAAARIRDRYDAEILDRI